LAQAFSYTESTKDFQGTGQTKVYFISLPISFLQTNHQLSSLENIKNFYFSLYFF